MGKVAVVTGASMGIGEQSPRFLPSAEREWCCCRARPARAESARQRIGQTDPDAGAFLRCAQPRGNRGRVLELTLHHFERVDIWVNNAGHGLLDSVASRHGGFPRDLRNQFVRRRSQPCRLSIPVMRQQGGGTIINISSVAGHIPLPFHAIYSATKFAMNAIGKGRASRTEERQGSMC